MNHFPRHHYNRQDLRAQRANICIPLMVPGCPCLQNNILLWPLPLEPCCPGSTRILQMVTVHGV